MPLSVKLKQANPEQIYNSAITRISKDDRKRVYSQGFLAIRKPVWIDPRPRSNGCLAVGRWRIQKAGAQSRTVMAAMATSAALLLNSAALASGCCASGGRKSIGRKVRVTSFLSSCSEKAVSNLGFDLTSNDRYGDTCCDAATSMRHLRMDAASAPAVRAKGGSVRTFPVHTRRREWSLHHVFSLCSP